MRRKRYAYENSEAMKIQRFDDAHRGDVGAWFIWEDLPLLIGLHFLPTCFKMELWKKIRKLKKR